MENFKVGQKVRISRNPIDPERSPQFSDGMREFRGRIVTIQSKTSSECYRIEEDNGRYYWAGRWFEKTNPDIIEISEDSVTLFRNNGKTFKSEHRVLIADFIGKVRLNEARVSNISTPLLPSNTKYYAMNNGVEVYVIEQSPQIRVIKWPIAKGKKGNAFRSYKLAFPYIVFICVVIDGKLAIIEGETPKCYYRTAPITSLNDALFHTNLMNVSSETGGLFFGTSQNDWEEGSREQMNKLLGNFWDSVPKKDMSSGCDFRFSAKIDRRIASVRTWQKESSSNSLFPLRLPWLKSADTIHEAVLSSLDNFSSLKVEREKIQHVSQLAEIAKRLSEI